MSDLELYENLRYSIEVVPEQDEEGQILYLATHPELSGCMSHGETPDEAIANLDEARALYIATLLDKRIDIPLPALSPTTTSGTVSSMVWKILSSERTEPEKDPITLQPSPTP